MTIYSDGTCVTCGESFPRINSRQYTCSVACRLKAKTAIDANGCWKYQGSARSANGYARVGIDGQNVPAHRASYEAFKGAIPPGMDVCHTCDVRDCINPDHLFLGTRLDNMQDAARKKRMPREEAHPNAKLTSEDVRAIRSDMASLRNIAARYGVGQTAVFQIKHRNYWRDVA